MIRFHNHVAQNTLSDTLKNKSFLWVRHKKYGKDKFETKSLTGPAEKKKKIPVESCYL